MEHSQPVSIEAKALQSLFAGGAPGRGGHLIDGHCLHVPCEGRQPVCPDPPAHMSSALTCTPGLSKEQSLASEHALGNRSTSQCPGCKMQWVGFASLKGSRLQLVGRAAHVSLIPYIKWQTTPMTSATCQLSTPALCAPVFLDNAVLLIMRSAHHPLPDKVALRPTDPRGRGGHPPWRDCRPDDGIAREHNQQQQHDPTCAHMTPLDVAQAGHTGGAWRHILPDA